MKTIRFDVLRVTVGVFFVSLLLGASAASAGDVVFGSLAGKAIGITDLDIDGTLYDVTFDEDATALSVYGELPGTFSLTADEAAAAATAMVAALNTAGAVLVGEDTSENGLLNVNFSIGVDSVGLPPPPEDPIAFFVVIAEGNFTLGVLGEWEGPRTDQESWSFEDRTYVVFTQVSPPDTAVDIDVDPWEGGEDNVVYPNSDYPISVAVLGSDEFDVMQINPATVKLGFATTYTPDPWFEDFDHDPSSFTDATFAFHTEETGIFCNDTEVTLTGETFGGDKFSGTDTIDATDCEELICHTR